MNGAPTDLDSAAKRRALLESLKNRRDAEAASRSQLLPRGSSEPPPASFVQQRFWFLQQIEPRSRISNNPVGMRISGHVDVDRVRIALQQVVNRHEILRTCFRFEGERLVQIIQGEMSAALEVQDLRAFAASEQEARLAESARDLAALVFDVSQAPLFRARLVLLSESHVLMFNLHHLICDAWSLGVLSREVALVYFAGPLGDPQLQLPKLTVQYGDFAVWQHKYLTPELLDRQLSFWRDELAGVQPWRPQPDRIRLDGPDMADPSAGRRVLVKLGAETSTAFLTMCKQAEVTPYQAAMAAFVMVAHHYNGATDIGYGMPVTNRNDSAIENLIGPFVNTVIVRVQLTPDLTVSALLALVRKTVMGALAHQDVPYEKVVEDTQRRLGRQNANLFHVSFAYPQVPTRGTHFGGRELSRYEIDAGVSKFDLSISLTDWLDELGLAAEYRSTLYERESMEQLLGWISRAMEWFTRSLDRPISEFEWLTSPEREQVDASSRGPTQQVEPTVLDRVRSAMRERPEACAIRAGDRSLSYAQLERKVRAAAAALSTCELGDERHVGLCSSPSISAVQGVLAIWTAGGAFVPIDYQWPDARIATIVADAGIRTLATTRESAPRLQRLVEHVVCLDDCEDDLGTSAFDDASPHTAAYVMYTSGSTGTPKGVVVEHGSLARYIAWAESLLRDEQGELQCPFSTALSFDASLKQFLVPLTTGRELLIPPDDVRFDPRRLCAYLNEHSVTSFNCVPSQWAVMLECLEAESSAPNPVRRVILGGETPPSALVQRTFAALPGVRIFNIYGPTETTSAACCGELQRGRRITIGRPIASTNVYVLDAKLRALPRGAIGELCIGGQNVARGYHRRAQQTQAQFVQRGDERIYRTGDFARVLADGEIEWLGRRDFQVKVNGQRIELAEIESALCEHPEIVEAACALCAAGDRRELVAYCVLRPNAQPDALQGWLRGKLPAAMIPRVVTLDVLPRLSNGKLNRAQLELAAPLPQPAVQGPSPVGETQALVHAAWCEVLELERVGIRSNFFDVGGHSLALPRLQRALEQRLERAIPLADLLHHPTIEMQARQFANEPTPLSVEAPQARANGAKQALAKLRATKAHARRPTGLDRE